MNTRQTIIISTVLLIVAGLFLNFWNTDKTILNRQFNPKISVKPKDLNIAYDYYRKKIVPPKATPPYDWSHSGYGINTADVIREIYFEIKDFENKKKSDKKRNLTFFIVGSATSILIGGSVTLLSRDKKSESVTM